VTYAPEKLCAAQVGQVYAPDEISEICVRVARWGARGGVPWGVAAGPGQPGWGSGWAATGTTVAQGRVGAIWRPRHAGGGHLCVAQ
jgi:hypothetical protein